VRVGVAFLVKIITGEISEPFFLFRKVTFPFVNCKNEAIVLICLQKINWLLGRVSRIIFLGFSKI
jgi:hypothetical protein